VPDDEQPSGTNQWDVLNTVANRIPLTEISIVFLAIAMVVATIAALTATNHAVVQIVVVTLTFVVVMVALYILLRRMGTSTSPTTNGTLNQLQPGDLPAPPPTPSEYEMAIREVVERSEPMVQEEGPR